MSPQDKIHAPLTASPLDPNSEASAKSARTLLALIGDLEQATEGSAELDLEIWRVVSGHDWRFLNRDNETITWDKYGPLEIGNPCVSLDQFSRSLDAALSLIPEGMPWGVFTHQPFDGQFFAWCEGDVAEAGSVAVRRGLTPAIALCIAALRARSAQRMEAQRGETPLGGSTRAAAAPSSVAPPGRPRAAPG